jgi:glycosyltransferase involved in cell wall biosynthesis/peptidoglycan/xylan/chitin deacetylase (PgdA/CDA1 family)
MSAETLALSLVVPFKGASIGQLIRSLNRQAVAPSLFELIIIRESEFKFDPSELRNCPFSVTVVEHKRPLGFSGHSAGPMRNIGVRRAAADRIVFIDADCVLAEDCLLRHALPVTTGAQVGICGLARELPASQQGKRLDLSNHDELWVLSARDNREGLVNAAGETTPASWCEFYTCNASVSRDKLLAAGLFDESGHRNHDLDLAYRLHLCGVQFEIDPDCRVIHLEHPRSIWFREEQVKGWLRMAEEHPELSAMVSDKVVSLRRSRQRAQDMAEARFSAIARRLPGIRCGSTWVVRPGTSPEVVRNALVGVPFTRKVRGTSTEIFMRLERNCWDHSILVSEVADQPTVSVVIAAYNAEHSIGRAVESVLRQSDQSFELIVVDDASTDMTAHALLPYFSSKRLRLLSNVSNRGLAYCLNRALESCGGRYLLQLDADDWLEPDALEVLIDKFNGDREIGAIYGSARLHGPSDAGARVDGGFPASTPIDCLTYPFWQAPRIYRVDALKSVGGWRIDDANEGRYFEDRLMLANVAERYRISYDPRPLYNVVMNENSLSRKDALRAASAKLAILYARTAAQGTALSYKFNRGFLMANQFPNLPTTVHRRWSIIVPFRGTTDLLALSLRSWIESDARERDAELIVVVDGEQATVDSDALPQSSFIKVVQRAQRGGAAAARNTGVRCANHDWLLFSDFDRIVPPNVLQAHEARHAMTNAPAFVVADVFGRRVFSIVDPALPEDRKRHLLELTRFHPDFSRIAERILRKDYVRLLDPASPDVWHSAQRYAFTEAWQARWGEILLQYGEDLKFFPHRWLRLGAGSLSVSRQTLEALGGFDENFLAMEDWELGVRAQRGGCQIICAPEAEPLHQVHPVLTERIQTEEIARTKLAAEHPSAIENLQRASRDLVPPGGLQFVMRQGELENGRVTDDASDDYDGYVLTFDDGPHYLCTNRLLDVLEVLDAPATFFVLGKHARDNPTIIRRIAGAGHEIGIHGWYHRNWSTMTSRELIGQLSRAVQALEEIAGIRTKYYRPPYGALPPHAAAACATIGLRGIGWHISSRDWSGCSAADIKIELAPRSLGGKVLLFHDGSGAPEAAGEVLQWLVPGCRRAGLRDAPGLARSQAGN